MAYSMYSKKVAAHLGIEILENDKILFDVILACPSGIITAGNVNHLGIFAAIEAHDAFTSNKVGHVMKHLSRFFIA